MRLIPGRIAEAPFPSRFSHPLGVSPAPVDSGVYVINDKRGASIYARIPVITRSSSETMELHQSPRLRKSLPLSRRFFFLLVFTLVFFYYRVYCPDTIRINIISCLWILDPLWILSSSPAWHLLTYLSLDSNLLVPRVIPRREFSRLKFYWDDAGAN